MAKYDYNRGCLIGELIQEESLLPEGYAVLLEQVLQNWQVKIENCLLLAKNLNEIGSDIDCKLLAAFFWLGWEGAVTRSKLVTDIDCKLLAEFFWLGWEGAVTRSKLVKKSDPLDLFINTFINMISKK